MAETPEHNRQPRRLNALIYDISAELGMKMPDIPVFQQPSYAQCAEDIIVLGLVRAMAPDAVLAGAGKRYLEIGANHPVSCSATYLLHQGLGMTGVLVEANPDLIADLERHRANDTIVHAAVVTEPCQSVEFHVSNQDELSSLDRRFVDEWHGGEVGLRHSVNVPAITINDLLAAHFGDHSPLFMSIDIEGMDLEVLRSMDLNRWRPAIIQAEPSEHHLPGNTQALVSLFNENGYRVVARTDVNLIALDMNRTRNAWF
jgi:FkbM family methyltransferase